jgi:hypothetical protein
VVNTKLSGRQAEGYGTLIGSVFSNGDFPVAVAFLGWKDRGTSIDGQ